MKPFLLILPLVLGWQVAHGNVFEQLDQCQYTCAPRCEKLIQRLSNKMDRVQSACGGGSTGSIRLFRSDSCSSNYVTSIDAHSPCQEMAGHISSRIWGMQVNGQCIDISDVDFLTSCIAFKNIDRSTVEFYRSDSCSSNLVAAVNPRTNCQRLSRHITSNVWGIKVNGYCLDVSDTNFEEACYRYKNEY